MDIPGVEVVIVNAGKFEAGKKHVPQLLGQKLGVVLYRPSFFKQEKTPAAYVSDPPHGSTFGIPLFVNNVSKVV